MNQRRILGIMLTSFGILLLLILSLVKTDVDRQGAFLCETVSKTGGDMASCPAHESDSSWLITLGFGLSLLVAGAGLVLLFIPFTLTKPQAKQDIRKLDAEERTLLEAVRAQEGSVYQGDLVRETGFSKVKTTRVLDRLEQKGIVERKRRGMTNLVVLK